MPARPADSGTTVPLHLPARTGERRSAERDAAERWSPERRAVERAGADRQVSPAEGAAEEPGHRARGRSPRRRTLWRPVALVLVLALLGALAGFLWGSGHPVQFQGRSDVLVESNVSLTGDLQPFQVTDRDVTTQQTLVASPTVVAEASRRAGTDLSEAVSVSAAPDSDILTLEAVQPTREGALRATDAYVRGYLAMVAARQKVQVDAQLKLAKDSDEAASQALDRLDGAVASTSAAQQSILLTLQSAERGSLAQQQRDAQDKVARLADAASRLPVNLQRVDPAPVLSPTGFTERTWVLLGAAAGLVVAVMVLARLAERRP